LRYCKKCLLFVESQPHIDQSFPDPESLLLQRYARAILFILVPWKSFMLFPRRPLDRNTYSMSFMAISSRCERVSLMKAALT
jgi:hypothetical protein